MLPLTRSRNRARFFGIPFSPSVLFAGGTVPGAWYDPSDYSTLFTDSAGTTPVTGVEQFVGLMLDKSKGLVLGPELVTNGTFDSNINGWSALDGRGMTGAWVSGTMELTTSATVRCGFSQNVTTVIGKTYSVVATVRAGTFTGTIEVSVNGIAGGPTTTNPLSPLTLSFIFTAISTTSRLQFVAASGSTAGLTFIVDNASLRELPGNHAFQTGSTKRPKLAARYNLLTYSEEFDNGAWTITAILAFGSGSVANATIAPDGTLTADLITPTASADTHRIYRAGTTVNAQSVTYSVYVKTNGYTKVGIRESATSGAGAAFDLSNGTVIGAFNSGGGTASNMSITDAGNGWYRIICTISFTSAANQSFGLHVLSPSYAAGSDLFGSWTPNGTSGIYIWGADLRPASQATGLIGPTYQRVVDAATYDTAGFLPYLQFDGIDDSMSTGSIDFTATDKMTVWAGVRKLSDVARAALIELSSGLPAGSFMVEAPDAAAQTRYAMRLAGNVGAAQAATPAVYSAPITNVITPIFDLAAATNLTKMDMRINGMDVAMIDAGGTVGSGNFGNYPLFIGARNNASLFFNGWLTSLIVRGAQSTQSQIEATEAWVAGKTGVQL